MTTTKKLLRAMMADGQPRSSLEIADLLGVDEMDARLFIANMRRDGYLSSTPVFYSLTDKGAARAKHEPKKIKKPSDEVTPRPTSDDMVRAAVRRNPNSVFNMGSPQ